MPDRKHVNPFFDDESPFRQLHVSGKYNEYIELADKEESDENTLWKILGYASKGDYSESKRLLETLSIDKLNPINRLNHFTLNGYACLRSAEINRASELFEKAHQVAIRLAAESPDSISIQRSLISSYLNLAAIHQNKGFFQAGIDELEKAEKISSSINDFDQIFAVKFSMSQLYHKLGNLEEAKKCVLESLSYYRQRSNSQAIARSLFILIGLTANSNRTECEAYLNELRILNDNSPEDHTRFIQLAYDLGLASFLKTSKRSREKIKAEIILKKLIDYNNTNLYYTVAAIPILLELLIVEYQSYQELEVLEEINKYLELMIEIAEKSSMNEFIISGKMIKAQLASIEGDFNKVEEIIDETIKFTEKHQLHHFQNQIMNVKSELDSQFEEMQRLTKENASFGHRLERSELLNYLLKAQSYIESEKNG